MFYIPELALLTGEKEGKAFPTFFRKHPGSFKEALMLFLLLFLGSLYFFQITLKWIPNNLCTIKYFRINIRMLNCVHNTVTRKMSFYQKVGNPKILEKVASLIFSGNLWH